MSKGGKSMGAQPACINPIRAGGLEILFWFCSSLGGGKEFWKPSAYVSHRDCRREFVSDDLMSVCLARSRGAVSGTSVQSGR